MLYNCNLVFFPQGSQQLDSIHVTQLERDTVLVCLDSKYYFKVYSKYTTWYNIPFHGIDSNRISKVDLQFSTLSGIVLLMKNVNWLQM